MWSYEIENMLRSDNSFIGCYPHDKLPGFKEKMNCSIIINTGNSATQGEHWVAIKMTKYKCFYFDSFGVNIVSDNIRKFVSKYKKVTDSDVCIQDIRSEACGYFCVAFMNNVNTVKSYDNFMKQFDYDKLYKNDFIVYNILKK